MPANDNPPLVDRGTFEEWAKTIQRYDAEKTTPIESVCEEAAKLVNQKRAEEYGSFKDIAEQALKIYGALNFDMPVIILEGARDVALFMVAFKLAREVVKSKRDNVVDACGYLEIYQKLKDGVEV